jgi:hypothetical protein
MRGYKKAVKSNQRLKLAGSVLTLYRYEKSLDSGLFDGLKSFSELDGGQRRVYTPEEIENRSRRRAYNKIVDTVNSNYTENGTFVLLTSPLKIGQLPELQKRFKKFIKLLGENLETRVAYTSVVELSSTSSTLHIHLLLYDVPHLEKSLMEEYWGFFVKMKKQRRRGNVGRYMAKYLSKGDLAIPYRKRYQQSHGLLSPMVTAVEEVVEYVRNMIPVGLSGFRYSYKSDYLREVVVEEYSLYDFPALVHTIRSDLTAYAL